MKMLWLFLLKKKRIIVYEIDWNRYFAQNLLK
jgi:hypothetical protein